MRIRQFLISAGLGLAMLGVAGGASADTKVEGPPAVAPDYWTSQTPIADNAATPLGALKAEAETTEVHHGRRHARRHWRRHWRRKWGPRWRPARRAARVYRHGRIYAPRRAYRRGWVLRPR